MIGKRGDFYWVDLDNVATPTLGAALQVKFQSGPVHTSGVNGVQIEDVIQVAIDRLTELNVAPFNCRENSLAITDLQSAQNWLRRRTADRVARGVEGTQVP